MPGRTIPEAGRSAGWQATAVWLARTPARPPRPLLIDAARPSRHALGDRWFVDETYVKIAGRWVYLYRAIAQFGQVIDVLVSETRDLAATADSSPTHSSTGRPPPRSPPTTRGCLMSWCPQPATSLSNTRTTGSKPCDVRLHETSGLCGWEVDVGRLRNSGKCSMPVPALACVTGNCGVRSRGEKPKDLRPVRRLQARGRVDG
jgi:hypothetical protein